MEIGTIHKVDSAVPVQSILLGFIQIEPVTTPHEDKSWHESWVGKYRH